MTRISSLGSALWVVFFALLAALLATAGCLPEIPADPDPGDAIVPSEGHLGWTEGAAGVTRDGAATYTIPLVAPEGRAGIEPSLSLRYSSRGGEGLSGLGWQLSGLSRITRCGRSLRLDGERCGVAFDDEDALCLDGERLVHSEEVESEEAEGGEAFPGGGQYRVWRNGLSKIELRGRLTDADAELVVWERDGRILTYGGAPSAMVRGTRSGEREEVIYAWLLRRVEDRAGNFLTVAWETDGAGPERRPREIRYTGFGEDPGRRSVRFTYAPRRWPIRRWVAGLGLHLHERLEEVSVYAPSAEDSSAEVLVRRYAFGYLEDEATFRTLLETVRECDAFGSCRRPLRFDWAPGAQDLPAPEETGVPVGLLDRDSLVAIDLDGDGVQELLGHDADFRWRVMRRAPGGWVLEETRFPNATRLLPFDYDHDGRAELLRWTGRTWVLSEVEVIGSGPGRPLLYDLRMLWPVTPECPRPSPDTLFTGDFDGDGAADLLSVCTDVDGTQRWSLLGHDGDWGRYLPLPVPRGLPETVMARVTDFEGDGRHELLAQDGLEVVSYALDRDPERSALGTGELVFADVNGDGLLDKIRLDGELRVAFNHGGRFGPLHPALAEDPIGAWSSSPEVHSAQAVDLNGDGRDDLVIHLEGRGVVAHLSDGYAFHTSAEEVAAARYVDLDRDGIPERLVESEDEESGRTWQIRRTSFVPAADLLTQVRQGTQPQASFEHAPYRERSVACTYPERCDARGMWVATRYEDALGRGFLHTYAEPRSDVHGEGWLGFGLHRVEAENSGEVIEQRFGVDVHLPRLGHPFAGVAVAERHTTPIGDGRFRVRTIEREHRALALSPFHHAVVQEREQVRDYELTDSSADPAGENPLREELSTARYDAFAEVIERTDSVPEGGSVTQTILRSNDPGTWLIGLPRWVRTTSEAGGRSATRTTFADYSAQGQLTLRTEEPGDPVAERSTELVRDARGLVTEITEQGVGMEPRTTALQRDEEGVYLRTRTNALGHVERLKVHPGLGVVTEHEDANGVLSTATYDGFGRLRSAHREGGWGFVQNYEVNLRHPGTVEVRTEQEGGGQSRAYVDPLGRVHEARVRLREGWSLQQTRFDAEGRPHELDLPHLEGETEYPRRTLIYDGLGRITETRFHDGQAPMQIAYDRRQTQVTDRRGHMVTATRDMLGRVVRSSEADDTSTLWTEQTYGPFGVVSELRDQSGQRWSRDYDAYGLLLRSEDPDSGVRLYEHNALGELTLERDGTGAVIARHTRDRLGRITRTESGADGVTIFEWDSARNGIGQLAAVTHDASRIEHRYDPYGRPQARIERIGGVTLEVRQSYDAHGRLARLLYPETEGDRLAIEHAYDEVGGLLSVTDLRNETVLWRAQAHDGAGRLTAASLGNGTLSTRGYEPRTGRLAHLDLSRGDESLLDQSFGYDATGNLTRRDDGLLGRSETFTYDGLDRLTRWIPNDGPAEDYGYDSAGNLTLLEGVEQRYGEGRAGPHQLTGIGPDLTRIDYDTRGRRLDLGDHEVLAYTDFDLPRHVRTPSGDVFLDHDGLGQRVRKRSSGSETLYFGELYQRRTEGMAITHRHRIYAGGQPIAEILEDEAGAHTRYLHADGLGSVIAVTDEAGAVLERSTYRPFGQRRSLEASALVSSEAPGFTGAEHDEELGLVNLRGRLYDPATGRFLTPDPIVRSLVDRQALNAYSYVENRPLTFADPSGLILIDMGEPGWGGAAGHTIGGALGWLFQQLTNHLTGGSSGPGHGGGGGGSGAQPRRREPNAPIIHDSESVLLDTVGVDQDGIRAAARRAGEIYRGGIDGFTHQGTPWSHEIEYPESYNAARQAGNGVGMVVDAWGMFQGASIIVGGVGGGGGLAVVTDGLLLPVGDALATASITAGSGMIGASWADLGRRMDRMRRGEGLVYSEGQGSGAETEGAPSTLRPGPHASDSVPARGPTRRFRVGERNQINEIGADTGCHTCGATENLGNSSGNFVPDHQPPNALNTEGGSQRLYPQCTNCSRRQGGQVRQEMRRRDGR